jgi:Family of unknown function (DUF6879)
VATLLDRLAAFRYSVFRLEALQDYRGSGEEDAQAAFQAGQPLPLTPALRTWTHLVRQRVHSGCVVQRVHVITLPLTDYIRFELASYARDGTWLGAERVTNPEQIVRACHARDAALHHSLPWIDYLRGYQPEITSYLAFTAGQS